MGHAPPPGGYGLPPSGAAPPPPSGFSSHAVPPAVIADPRNPNVYDPKQLAPSLAGGEATQAQTALTVGVLSLFCFGIITGPIAIVLALQARSQIAANPGLGGGGKATAALICGSIATALNVGLLLMGLISR